MVSDEEKKTLLANKKISPENSGISGLNSGVGGTQMKKNNYTPNPFNIYKIPFRCNDLGSLKEKSYFSSNCIDLL